MAASKQSRLLDYLPGIFQEQPDPGKEPSPDNQPFLAKFLSPFDSALAEFDDLLAELDRYFAPALAPPDDFLPWLATWVAVVLDEDWNEDKRRRLISEAVELYRWRGTIDGLKRYLEIYTELPPDAIDIRDAAWSGGMQIGVASRIGGTRQDGKLVHLPLDVQQKVQHERPAYHDYYIINTQSKAAATSADAEQPATRYYRASDVLEIRIVDGFVEIRCTGDPSLTRLEPVEPAGVRRRNDVIDDRYTLTVGASNPITIEYRGDTYLIEEVELPYRFIMHIRAPNTALMGLMQPDKLAKIRDIVDREKPAHTAYYLKFTETIRVAIPFMQIGVHSTVGFDTTVA